MLALQVFPLFVVRVGHAATSADACPIFACLLLMQASAVVIGKERALLAGLSLFRFGPLPEPGITEGLDPARIVQEVPECICDPAAFGIARCPTSEASESTGSGYTVATGVGSAAGAAVAHLVHRHGRPNTRSGR